MTGYVCIAMLEDPPYNLYLAATEELRFDDFIVCAYKMTRRNILV